MQQHQQRAAPPAAGSTCAPGTLGAVQHWHPASIPAAGPSTWSTALPPGNLPARPNQQQPSSSHDPKQQKLSGAQHSRPNPTVGPPASYPGQSPALAPQVPLRPYQQAVIHSTAQTSVPLQLHNQHHPGQLPTHNHQQPRRQPPVWSAPSIPGGHGPQDGSHPTWPAAPSKSPTSSQRNLYVRPCIRAA